MSFVLILISGTLKKLNMAKFKDYLLTKQEALEKETIELAEAGRNEEGEKLYIGTRQQWDRYADKWGENLSEWDEEPQD
jgi:hypothetical protein